MKVIGNDGREYSWNFKKSGAKSSCSKFHLRARLLLQKLFPMDIRIEELTLPGCKRLAADFYLPTRKLMVEVHGQQHYKYVQHFHGNKVGFVQSQGRDKNKVNFCERNDIRFCELPHDESDDEWTERILSC